MKLEQLEKKMKEYEKTRGIYEDTNLSEANQLEIQYINKLWMAKRTRTVAQYEADKTMSKEDSGNCYLPLEISLIV